MLRSRILFATAMVVASSSVVIVACGTHKDHAEETARIGASVITPAGVNYNVTPDFTGIHETSIAFASGYLRDGLVGRWVVGWNTGGATSAEAGWSYSVDYRGDLFTDNSQSSGTDFGNPGASPYDGASFTGWRGDPSIVAVTNPATNNGGVRMLYSMVACTNSCTEQNDVVVALSNDGGETWGSATYANGNGPGDAGPDHGGGSGADNPWLASNQASPYDTFIAWDRTSDGSAWLGNVSVTNPDSGSPGISVSGITQIPKPAGGTINHVRIDVGKYTTCGSAVHEAVFAVYADWGYARCPFDGQPHSTTAASWYMDVYDVVTSTWLGPWQLDATTLPWPNCVGGGTGPADAGCSISGNNPFCADNDPRAQIAVDWDATHGIFFVNHTINPAGHGTRVEVDQGYLACTSGSTTPVVAKVIDPPPCDPNDHGCQWGDAGIGPDGGPFIQDEWGQAISFNFNGTTPRVVETWFSTRDDPNNVNVDMYMMYSENLGVTWSAIQEITEMQAGQIIPWNYHLGDWSDYQSVAPDTVHGGFLGAWGGDCRSDAGTCTVYSEIMQ